MPTTHHHYYKRASNIFTARNYTNPSKMLSRLYRSQMSQTTYDYGRPIEMYPRINRFTLPTTNNEDNYHNNRSSIKMFPRHK
jgi:hypothetical protein